MKHKRGLELVGIIVVLVATFVGGFIYFLKINRDQKIHENFSVTQKIPTDTSNLRCSWTPQTPEEAVKELHNAIDDGNINKIICLNDTDKRESMIDVMSAIEKNGTMPQFFRELKNMKEDHRTGDYAEYKIITQEKDGETENTIYLIKNPLLKGWFFDGF